VNDPERMDTLIDLGVDGIITDYPDRLRAVMQRRGMVLPQPTPVSP
jgi:glycerophosphoryl diester phosphodiesterase